MVKEIIDNKLLTFKENVPGIYILITGSDNDEVKGSPKSFEISTYQEGVEALATNVNDISGVNGSTQNDQMFASKQFKAIVGETALESTSGKNIPHPSKGQYPSEEALTRKKFKGKTREISTSSLTSMESLTFG